MERIDLLDSLKDFMKRDSYTNSVYNILVKNGMPDNLNIMEFLTMSNRLKQMKIDDTDIEFIKMEFGKYGLRLDMSEYEINSYQDKTRQIFGECSSSEEVMNKYVEEDNNISEFVPELEEIKELKPAPISKNEGTVVEVKTIPLNRPVSCKEDNPDVDDETFFRYMMMYKKEMGTDIMESYDAVDKFFRLRNNKKVSKRTDNVLPAKPSSDSPSVKKDKLDYKLTLQQKLILSAKEFQSFFTVDDLNDAINKKFNASHRINSVYGLIPFVIKAGYIKKVSAEIYPRSDNSCVYISKDCEEELTYKDYYKWLKSKNPTFKTLMECGKRFTTSEFTQEAAKNEICPKKVLQTLQKKGLIVHEGFGKYKRAKLLSGQLQFES